MLMSHATMYDHIHTMDIRHSLKQDITELTTASTVQVSIILFRRIQ